MTNGNKIAGRGDHTNDIAFLNAVVNMLNGTRKDPGMESQQAFLLTSF